MKNQLSIRIKTPCTKNFNNFKPTSDGGFCDSCEKEVIDFTKMKSQEIINYFKNKETQNTCGRFNDYQLKTYKTKSKKRKRNSIFSSIGLACLSLFTFNTIQAQGLIKQTENKDSKSSKNITENYGKDLLVKGNVTENSLPLPGVNILLEGTTIGTQTDFDGNFEFPKKLKKGDVLIFSYIGFTSQKVAIIDENSVSKIVLQIDMEMASCVLMGKVAVKKVYTSKKKQ